MALSDMMLGWLYENLLQRLGCLIVRKYAAKVVIKWESAKEKARKVASLHFFFAFSALPSSASVHKLYRGFYENRLNFQRTAIDRFMDSRMVVVLAI